VKSNVGLFLQKRAQLNPSLEAFIDTHSNRRLSFADLDARANRTAHFLARDLGVRKGDRVALLMMNSPEFLESFFAIAKLGAVCVPLNWRLVPDELQFILKDSGSKTLLYGGEFAQTVGELHKRGPATDVRHWVHQGGDATRGQFALDYDALQRAASAEAPACTACDDDLLYIMYTSGTTGLPKGAVHTHETAMWGVLTIGATAEMRLKDRYLVSLPFFHVGALTPITLNIYKGVTSVVMRAFDPTKVWELIQSERVTVALKVPAMLNFMLQSYDPKKYDISSLRWIMSGAAPGAGDPDRGVREARHRDPPGLRAHRELRPRVPDRRGRCDREGGLDGQSVLPHRRARDRRQGEGHPARRAGRGDHLRRTS
jgi:acyl-CoA synthetase (AMP-forming)/AMP-acid ligase II